MSMGFVSLNVRFWVVTRIAAISAQIVLAASLLSKLTYEPLIGCLWGESGPTACTKLIDENGFQSNIFAVTGGMLKELAEKSGPAYSS